MTVNPFAQQPDPERPERPRNPFAAKPELERPKRPAVDPFRVDPFASLPAGQRNPSAPSMSDSDAAYFTALLVYEIAEFLDGGAS